MWENVLRQVGILKMKATDFSVTLFQYPGNGNFQITRDLMVTKVLHYTTAEFWETGCSLVNRNVSEGSAAPIFRTVTWPEWHKTAKFSVTFTRIWHSGRAVPTFQRKLLPTSSVLSLHPRRLFHGQPFSSGGSRFVWNVGAHSLHNLPGQVPPDIYVPLLLFRPTNY
jgi:hypothetical protein